MFTLKVSLRALIAFVTLCSISLVIAGVGGSLSGGIDTPTAAVQGVDLGAGATCHSELPTATVTPVITGIPGNYSKPDTPGGPYAAKEYRLNISILGGPEPSESGAQGGFNLFVGGGKLTVPKEMDGLVQIKETGEATHTSAGNKQRNWTVLWTSPDKADDPVKFRLTVNAVNGIKGNDAGDQWNRLVQFSEGLSGAPAGGVAKPLQIESLGVNWLAYWVGIASFVFLIVVLFVYYFVFRYSETSHATDHRARKEKK